MRLPAALILCFALVGCSDGDSPTGPSSSLFSRSGTGNDVVDKPSSVTRVRITGRYTLDGSNFIVWCGSNLLVNEIIGTRYPSTTYTGTHSTPNCSSFEIRNSTGVAWEITEVR